MSEIALLATVRDEAPYLIDWIAHHRAIGVTRFVIYQNDSVDGTDSLLQALQDAGEITYLDNTDPASAPPRFRALAPQRRAYGWALRHADIQTADYMLVVDVDEYLELPQDHDIPTLIERLDQPDVICFPWRMMGSNGQTGFAPDPVTARFTRAASIDEPTTVRPLKQVKSLYRPKITRFYNLHKPRALREGVNWRDADGRDIVPLMGKSNQLPDFTYDTANLRHYHVKSFPEFCVKIVRGFACTPIPERSQLGAKMFNALDLNTVALPMPAALAEKTAQIAARLRGNPKIADAESRSIPRYDKLTNLCQKAVQSHDTLPDFISRYGISADLQSYFEAEVWSKMRL